MVYSSAALHAFLMREYLRMTNAQCWKRFPTSDALAKEARKHDRDLAPLSEQFLFGAPVPGADGMICPFDEGFPALNPFSPMGDRPFLLFYRGDLSLLADLNRNVAVVGATDPDDGAVAREQAIVSRLAAEKLTIVSGLAKGCDTVSHRACLAAGGKTIAILPSQLAKIYPARNRDLADQIVGAGGLLLSEYASDAADRYAAVKRFIDRDRLQALFSKAVILIASRRKGDGGSGARHAMKSAQKYRIGQYVMFDPARDSGKALFGLNQDLLNSGSGVKVLRDSLIPALALERNTALARTAAAEQLTLDLDGGGRTAKRE